MGPNKPRKCLIFLSFFLLFSSQRKSVIDFNNATCYTNRENYVFHCYFNVILENSSLYYLTLAMKLRFFSPERCNRIFQQEISKESLYYKEFVALLKFSFTLEDPEIRFSLLKETFPRLLGERSISFFFWYNLQIFNQKTALPSPLHQKNNCQERQTLYINKNVA